jgi:hypothetical protein
MGWPTGLLIDAGKGTPTDNNIPINLLLQNTIIAGSGTPVKYTASATSPTGATDATINTWFSTAAYGNSILANNRDVELGAPFNYTTPDFNPATGSPASSGGSFTNAKSATGFSPVTYKGACAVGDTWWKTWTKFM